MTKAVLLKRLALVATLPLAAVVSSSALAQAPDALNMAVIVGAGPESAWDGTFIDALTAVAADSPHGLDLTFRVSDPLWGDDAENAMRLYAQSGQFDIIWAHSSYSDQVKALKDEFPDIMFVVTGSGNEGLGGNQYWVYKRVHEPAYLLGVLAGTATESDVVGVVGTFPADDVNDEINAFLAGARSANPELVAKVAFTESWYDPAKAAEYMNAQVAAGADLIFTLADNFAPCDEHGIVCIGNFRDDSDRSERILSAPLAAWEQDIENVIDAWVEHKAAGTPFDGNTEPDWLSMGEGGSAVAPFDGREALVSPEAIAAFEQASADLAAGTLQVPLDTALPTSD